MISHKESHSFLNTDQNCFRQHRKDLKQTNVLDKLCIQAYEPRKRQKKHTRNISRQEPSFLRDIWTLTSIIQYLCRSFSKIFTSRSMYP